MSENITNTLLSFWQPIKNFIPKIPTVILTLIVGYLAIKILLTVLIRALKFSKLPKALINLMVSLSSIVMWVILLAELARQIGMGSLAVTISGSLAVFALALATGASALASDILAGIFLARDSDFEIGYRIKVGDVEGIVQQVDIRKIRIIDDKGKVIILPNAKLDKDGWEVISREVEDNKIEIKKLQK